MSCGQKGCLEATSQVAEFATSKNADLVCSNTGDLGYTRYMRIALYARVSRDDGRQDTENQLHELREFCERSKWDIVGEYVDKASGGKSDKERPQLRKLFQDASKRKFDLVLFWALDRFSREGTFQTLEYLERLNKLGVEWKSYQESYLDSCGRFKDVVIALMATLAKQERLRISERTKAGLQRARRQGKVLGRPTLDVDVDKVQRMQQRGLGLRAIAKETGWSLSSIVRARRNG